MKKYWLLPAVLLLAAAALVAIRSMGEEDLWLCENGEWIRHGTPNISKPVSPCAPVKRQANIIVAYPEAGAVLGDQFTVSGQARVFENQFNLRLSRLASGTAEKIFEQPLTSDARDAGEFGAFSHQVDMLDYYSRVSDGDYLLEVFDYSAKDGAEIDKASVPIKYIARYQSINLRSKIDDFVFFYPVGWQARSGIGTSTDLIYYSGTDGFINVKGIDFGTSTLPRDETAVLSTLAEREAKRPGAPYGSNPKFETVKLTSGLSGRFIMPSDDQNESQNHQAAFVMDISFSPLTVDSKGKNGKWMSSDFDYLLVISNRARIKELVNLIKIDPIK